jgi:6-phosphogluconolactonase (cycloisomerase 2 family)
VRWSSAVTALVLALAALGCDSGPPRFAYVANGDSDDVSAFRIESSGALRSLGSAAPVTRRPIGLLPAPSGRFLYVVGGGGRPRYEDSGGLSVLAVDARHGTLTSVAEVHTEGRLSVAALAPSGRYLYALQTTIGRGPAAGTSTYAIVTFAVDPTTGALTPSGRPVELGGGSTLTVDPDGRFLYVVVFAWDKPASFKAFALDPQTGALGPSTDVAQSGSQPARMLWLRDRPLLYVSDRGAPGRASGAAVHGFVMDRDTGALAEMSGSPFPTGMGAASNHLAASDDGRLYVGNVDFVSTFLVDATSGALAPDVPARTRVSGRVGAIASYANRLYVTVLGQADAGSVVVFEPKARGQEMEQLKGSPFPAGRTPVAIVIVQPSS